MSRKVPPPVPVIGQSADSSREEQLRQWEEAERQRREQAAAAQPPVPVPVQAPPTATEATPPAAPAVRAETPGYLEMPGFTEPGSTDPGERLEFYTRGIMAVQYAARANHERAEQQKLIGLGLRLRAVKEEELHKVAGFDTFGDLTEARFGIKKHQANNVIRVTPVAQALEDITTQELKERPLRILVPILDTHGVDAVRATWNEAARHGNVTDKTLEQAANFLGYAPPKDLTTGTEKRPEKAAAAGASESLKAVERIRTLAATDPARARREAQELESAVRELLMELTQEYVA